MKVFHQLEEIKEAKRARAVAIGNFDGIHLGHQKLISTMVQAAKQQNLVSSILTFYPHPVEILNPGKKIERITTTTEKLSLLEKCQVEEVFIAPFDKTLSELGAEAFVKRFLSEGMSAKKVFVGENFFFGKGREGDSVVLKTCGDKFGFETEVVSLKTEFQNKIASSKIRELIKSGSITIANQCLGYSYFLEGEVTFGDQKGAEFGFATANVQYSAEKVLPKIGVYIAKVNWQRVDYEAVCNLGFRPTVDNVQKLVPVLEVHLFNFSAKIYRETLRVEFLERLRDEKKFENISQLKEQVQKDIQKTKEYFHKRKKSPC